MAYPYLTLEEKYNSLCPEYKQRIKELGYSKTDEDAVDYFFIKEQDFIWKVEHTKQEEDFNNGWFRWWDE